MPTLEHVYRQCIITKKKHPRRDLIRLVRTPDGSVHFDKEYTLAGRGLHFFKDQKIAKTLLIPQKRKMLEHFLKASLNSEQIDMLSDQVLHFLSQNT